MSNEEAIFFRRVDSTEVFFLKLKKDVDLDKLKVSLVKNYIKDIKDLTDNDINFLIAETKSNKEYINSILETIGR